MSLIWELEASLAGSFLRHLLVYNLLNVLSNWLDPCISIFSYIRTISQYNGLPISAQKQLHPKCHPENLCTLLEREKISPAASKQHYNFAFRKRKIWKTYDTRPGHNNTHPENKFIAPPDRLEIHRIGKWYFCEGTYSDQVGRRRRMLE